MKQALAIFLLLLTGYRAIAQRQYTTASVLASGNIYKIAVRQQGIFKVDVAMFASMGMNTSAIPSASIRLFGNGGAMLPENNAAIVADDLVENAIQVFDGGDGVFNGNDYFIFYSTGPVIWLADSLNKSFSHQANLYTEVCYYYLSVGGIGKRVTTSNFAGLPNVTVAEFDDRVYHELDTINFLKSGKQWYGEEFSNLPGRSTSRTFNYNFSSLVTTAPVLLQTSLVARSVSVSSRFDISVNGQPIASTPIAAVTGNFLDAFGVETNITRSVSVSQPNVSLSYTFIGGNYDAQGWLNWFEIMCRRRLEMNGITQQTFRDWQSVHAGNVANFVLTGTVTGAHVWDVTDPLAVQRMNTTGSGTIQFTNDASRLREYIYFNGNSFFTPEPIGRIENQNLHALPAADYIIVTSPTLKNEAMRLAAFHKSHTQLTTIVATTDQVFNEFSSGIADPSAMRNFVKMFYDRAGNDTTKQPKYLALFGDASFDYKNRVNRNTNLVPAYESPNSLDPLSTYTSDDFFGLLDNGDDINATSPPSLLDIGIGRISATNSKEASAFVDKVINYHNPIALGPWRNQLTFVADDEDANLHVQDAEVLTSTSSTINPLLNINKIYLDAYQQQSGSGGSRYPAVNQAIVNQVYNGNLVWNYSGHGGSLRLAEEAILDADVVRQFNNPNKLPLIITATCDFAPFDDPGQRSIGENLLVENTHGAIALTTTTRFVYAFSNRIINNNFLQYLLQQDAQGQYKTLGQSLRSAKNYTYSSSPDIINNRKFTLLGDPAMKLAFPEYRILVNGINGRVPTGSDTLKGLDKYTIDGVVTDVNGNVLQGFNGIIYPSVFDKSLLVTTLGNDAGSTPTTFAQQNNAIYKGKASVTNGHFTFSFIIPKDIGYQAGAGRMSLYAENGLKDGNGVFTNFSIGGTGGTFSNDREGPSIQVFLNDEKFANGGLVNEQPLLLVKLADSSGINTSVSGIGHDITAVLDENDKDVKVLNDFYEAALDDYKQGTVRFQLPVLDAGNHTLKIKAWDVANNPGEQIINFTVAKSEQLQLSHVLNYPNPFTTKTNFWFEHNQPASSLKVLVQIYSVAGKLVHQIQKVVLSNGNRITEIEWDGKDTYGNRVGRGVYIYKISVTGMDGKAVEKIEKLYVL
jgi:hypothetical protein